MRKNLPSFRVTFTDGTSYVTSMAAGITLDDARAYFIGQEFVAANDKTRRTVASVEQLACGL